MLALKLLLVPGFLALVSLAGRRFGPAFAGWLAGFPVVAGSILFVLALEHGAGFAADAATAALPAVFASTCFSLAYARACIRRPWTRASPLAIGAWALASVAVSLLPPDARLGFAIACASLLVAPPLFPAVATLPCASRVSQRELALRMAAGAALTVLVSALAAAIGPARSGILSVFPVIGVVLTAFSQREAGPAFVVSLIKPMLRGLWSFIAFCVALAALLPRAGIAPAFAAAALLAVLVQGAMRAWLQRRAVTN